MAIQRIGVERETTGTSPPPNILNGAGGFGSGQGVAKFANAAAQLGQVLANMDITRRRAQNATTVENTKNEIATGIETAYIDNKNSIQDPTLFENAFNEDVRKLLDKSMAGKNTAVRKELETYRQRAISSAMLAGKKEAIQKTNDAIIATDMVTYEHLQNRAIKDISNGDMDAPDKAINDYTMTIDKYAETGGMSQAQATHKIQAFTEQVRMGTFGYLLQQHPTQVHNNVESVIKDLGLNETQAMAARKQALIGATSERHKFDKTRQVNTQMIIENGTGYPEFEEKAAGVYGADFPEVQKEIEIARGYHEAAKGMEFDTIDAINEKQQSLDPTRKPMSDNPDRDFALFGMFNQKLNRMLEERKNDPAGFVEKNLAGLQTLGQTRRTPEQRIDNSLGMQEAMGIPPADRRALPKADAGRIVENLRNAFSSSDKLDYLDSLGLQENYGVHAGKVISEAVAAGMPFEAVYSTVSGISDTTKKNLMNISTQKVADLKKLIPETGNDIIKETQTAYTGEFGKTIQPDNFKHLLQHGEIATKLALFYGNQGVNNPAEKALQDLYGAYNYADTLRIPKDYDKSAVTRFGQFILNQGLNMDKDAWATGDVDFQLWLTKIQSSGSWYTNEDESGMVLYDAEDAPVLTKDGKPMEYRFSDILATDIYYSDTQGLVGELPASMRPGGSR